ncbi:hypothetical protein BKA70DRAFT_1297071 [Coprinopsis sp. MPI-PUGE-AT-0042]|nr:hypothetical protein BKA70DRAFT_1297071 [Coprinopsis sp. MPI-PUGE-AT-0042]
MYRFFAIFALFAALAGQALAFNIALGTTNLTHTTILDIPQSPATLDEKVVSVCDPAKQQIAACNDNMTCLCQTNVVTSLKTCESAMLAYLIWKNIPAPDPRVGSNIVMGAYWKACNDTEGIPKLDATLSGLELPATWDGPFVSVLPVGGAVVVVLVTGFLGISAIFLLSNM